MRERVAEEGGRGRAETETDRVHLSWDRKNVEPSRGERLETMEAEGARRAKRRRTRRGGGGIEGGEGEEWRENVDAQDTVGFPLFAGGNSFATAHRFRIED